MAFNSTIETTLISGFSNQSAKFTSQFSFSFLSTVESEMAFLTTVVAYSAFRFTFLFYFRLGLLVRAFKGKVTFFLAPITCDILSLFSLYWNFYLFFRFRFYIRLRLSTHGVSKLFTWCLGWTIILKMTFLTAYTTCCQWFFKLREHSNLEIYVLLETSGGKYAV